MTTVLAAAAVSACGGSGFRYVQNSDEHVYFKVPDDWAMFDEEDVLTPEVALVDEPVAEAMRVRTWLRGFDAAPDPSPAAVLNRASTFPRGYGMVRLLTRSERDRISLADLRSFGIGVDPLAAMEEDPYGDVRLLHLEEVANDDGTHGVRLIVQIRGEDRQTSIVDQTVLLDAETTRLYRFTVGCLLDCYERHRDLLTEIAESWTLKEV